MFAPTRTFMPLALLAAVVVTCLQGAAFAGAAPMEPNGRTVSVPVAGLNLASPEAQARLDATLKRAARQVCAPEDSRDLSAVANRAACEKTALANAKARRDVLVAQAQAGQLASRATVVPATN